MKQKSLAILVLMPALWADAIRLRDGSTLAGKVIDSDPQQIRIQVSGDTRSFAVNDIATVVFGTDPVVAAPARTASVPPKPTAMVPPAPSVQEALGFTVRLGGCQRHATASISCTYSIVNRKADRQVGLRHASLVDSAGMAQDVQQAKLGSAQGSTWVPAIYDTAIPGEIVFRGVTPDITHLAKLTLNFRGDGGDFEIAFRNVPLPLAATARKP